MKRFANSLKRETFKEYFVYNNSCNAQQTLRQSELAQLSKVKCVLPMEIQMTIRETRVAAGRGREAK